jgi:hypothetical protein
VVVAVVFQVGFWAYAQNVTTAAAQEAARAASAQGGDLEHGLVVGNSLLRAGLGPTIEMVTLTGREDANSVTIDASGGLPLGVGPISPLRLPLDTEVRVMRQTWIP